MPVYPETPKLQARGFESLKKILFMLNLVLICFLMAIFIGLKSWIKVGDFESAMVLFYQNNISIPLDLNRPSGVGLSKHHPRLGG
jgi:hypothetical protein